MCCVTPTERSSRAPAPARAPCARCARGCSSRSLAHRLRRIGDQLEKRRAAENKSPQNQQNPQNQRDRAASLRNIHAMCAAIQVTVLVLFVGKRHL